MSLRETPEVFGESPDRLRGVLHEPSQMPRRGLVICCPFGEERGKSARVTTLAARHFCQQGFAVLRFDYRGTGESDGAIETATPGQWVSDIEQARRHLSARTGLSRIGLLGIRFGVALAARVPGRGEPLPFLVCWAPVWTGRDCLAQCARHLAATRLVVDDPGQMFERLGPDAPPDGRIDAGGWLVGHAMAIELGQLDLTREAQAAAEAVIVIRLSGQTDVSRVDRAICRRLTWPAGSSRLMTLPGRPFWVTASRFDPQPLVDRTIEVLNECDRDAPRPEAPPLRLTR